MSAAQEASGKERGRFPTDEVTGYLELPGPKLGREYTDGLLRGQLEESLAALREEFPE